MENMAMGGMVMPPPPSSSSGGGMDMGGGGGSDAGMSMMHMTFFWGKRVEILFSGWPADRGVGMYLLALLFVAAAAALAEGLSSATRRLSSSSSSPRPLLLAAIHAVRMGLLYLVMLAAMSFNAGVFLAAVAGHALGFLASFRWARGPADGAALPTKS